MQYREYINQISFRFLQPNMRPRIFNRIARVLRACGLSAEELNTRLPVGGAAMRARLRGLRDVPRMSTVAIAAMINEAVAQMPTEASFVNVGVWNGYSFLSGMIGNPDKTCIGIDNFSEFGGPREAFLSRFEMLRSHNHSFHEMDYKDYFAGQHEGQIGCYLYDGEHSYSNQLEGLRVAEPFFAKNAIVIIDDTNLDAPRQATLDFMQESAFRYEILLDRKTCANKHPTLWNGVFVIQRIG